MHWLREKFGTIVVSAIIFFIAVVFAVEGVFYPKMSGSLHDSSMAGKVNGEPISYSEFNHALEQRKNFLRQMTGGKLNEAQMRAFHLKQGVFNELVGRKLMTQAADSAGMEPSDEEVRAEIQKMDVFHDKSGKFDYQRYQQILRANGYSETRFENMMRSDLAVQQWNDYFRDRVRVSDEEIRQQFLVDNDKRNIKYVLITPQTVAKGAFTDAEVAKFAADPKNVPHIKAQYQAGKTSIYKSLSQKAAYQKIARDLMAERQVTKLDKKGSELADRIAKLMTADKASDARIRKEFKDYAIEVKYTGMINPLSRFIPGIGEARELTRDAFLDKSPIDPADGGKAKKYDASSWYIVAIVSDRQKPDLSKFESERGKILASLTQQKERALYQAWMMKLQKNAKIETNPDIVNDKNDDQG